MRKPKIKGGYVVIPDTTIKCNQYKSLRATTRAVYTAMLTEFIRNNTINPENLVKISHTQMQEISGLGHSTVVRSVRQLKDKGFIRVHEQGGLEGRPTTFQLNRRFLQTGTLEAYW